MLKRAAVIIEKWRSKWFPTGDDEVWKQWVDYERREARDLVQLLTSDVRDTFKRRAVFLLLVPAAELSPIYWTEEVGRFWRGSGFIEHLTPDLLDYATDLVVEFCAMLKPEHCDRPKQYSQSGCGITILMSLPDKYHNALSFYNNCILQLLTLIPEERRERIFPLFSLRDISTYRNMDDASGYNPFQNLLYSKTDEKWKRRADAAMRQVIRDESVGITRPREDWEDALWCYSRAIGIQLYGKDLHYGIDFFADQVRFLTSEEHYGHDLIENSNIARIFQILSSDAYKEIRYQVARFIVFGKKDKFQVWESTLQGANMMLSEFGQDDEELAMRIRSAIEEDEKRSAERQAELANAEKNRENLMSQMR